MSYYKILNKQVFKFGNVELVPLRIQDRYDIMKWRNEQIYHLRQTKPLTVEEQDRYFNTVIPQLFKQDQPNQILFSLIENGECIGYGGLVHINWDDRNAEISFIMNTKLEEAGFEKYWSLFLKLIEDVAFEELSFHKVFVYAFDLRPHLYDVLESCKYVLDARLTEHCFYKGKYLDVVIHSKLARI